MNYKAVGFDYGGVITGQLGSETGSDLAKLLEVTEKDYQQAYYNYNVAFNRGQITRQELWQKILAELNKSDKITQLTNFFEGLDFGKPNKQILNLVDNLRGQGYKVGLLSNNSKEMANKIRRDDLGKHFDVLNISAETGFVKPEPEAFKHFAHDLEVELNELVFVDDSKKSLSRASETGYRPILYKGYDGLLKQLKRIGVYQA